MSLFEYTYWTGTKYGPKRIVFVWSGRSRGEADEAFEEVMGCPLEEVMGVVVEVKRLS